jgi:hypothetical protein
MEYRKVQSKHLQQIAQAGAQAVAFGTRVYALAIQCITQAEWK